MAQIINTDAKRIEEAAELATKLISSHTAEGRRFRFPLLEGELQKEQAGDVERLHELLKRWTSHLRPSAARGEQSPVA